MQFITHNPKETYHTWQRLFNYVTDCRLESTKTKWGQDKGNLTYSVYAHNASIIIDS